MRLLSTKSSSANISKMAILIALMKKSEIFPNGFFKKAVRTLTIRWFWTSREARGLELSNSQNFHLFRPGGGPKTSWSDVFDQPDGIKSGVLTRRQSQPERFAWGSEALNSQKSRVLRLFGSKIFFLSTLLAVSTFELWVTAQEHILRLKTWLFHAFLILARCGGFSSF